MTPESLAWAEANFDISFRERSPRDIVILFIDKKTGEIIDCYYSTASNIKQLKYDVNTFMLELEEIL